MKRSLFYVFLAAIQAVGSIGSPLLAAREIGPRELGVIAVGMLVSTAVRALASLGLYGPVSVALHQGEEGMARARRLLRWSGIACLPVSLLLLAIGFLVDDVVGAYVFAAAAGVCGAVALGHQALHRSIVNHPAYAVSTLGTTAVANLMGLAVILTVGGGAREFLCAMAITSVFSASYLHIRYVLRTGRLQQGEMRHALRIGLPLVLTAAATVGLSLGDRPLVQGFLGDAAAGRYHLTYIIAAGGVQLLAALNNAWLPTILNVETDRRLAAVGRSTRGVVLGMLPLTVGAAIAAPALVNVIGGHSFVNGTTATLAAVIAAGVIPYAVYSGMCIGLLSIEGTRSIAAATLSGLVVNMAVNLALIPWLGVVGAALASVLGYSVAAVVGWRRLGGRSAVPWLDLRLIGAAALTVMVVSGSTLVPIDGVAGTILRMVAGFLIGLAGCLLVARASSAAGADRIIEVQEKS